MIIIDLLSSERNNKAIFVLEKKEGTERQVTWLWYMSGYEIVGGGHLWTHIALWAGPGTAGTNLVPSPLWIS